MKPWRTFVTHKDNLLSIGLTGHVFGKRPSDLLEISKGSQLAIDLDLAAAREVVRYQNQRDYKRFASLIKNLACIVAAANGLDPKKILNADPDPDPADDPAVDDANVL